MIPGFWNGGGEWKLRYSSPNTGVYTYQTVSTDQDDAGLHGQTGNFEITSYMGDNPLYHHGPLRKSTNHSYLEHVDDKPFFWLGDTWWMSLTKRLPYESFQQLTRDRVDKGFTVIQVVAGLYPDMDPFDDRGQMKRDSLGMSNFIRLTPRISGRLMRSCSPLLRRGLFLAW